MRSDMVIDPFPGEDVVIMLKGKNTVTKRVPELPQSAKFRKTHVIQRKNV
jgi:hypothetical protein